jgi:hypothetical protein
MTSQLLVELGQMERGMTGATSGVSPALLCKMVKRKVKSFAERVDKACERYEQAGGP